MITADYSIKESMTPVHTVTSSLITNRCVSMMNTMPTPQSRSLSLAQLHSHMPTVLAATRAHTAATPPFVAHPPTHTRCLLDDLCFTHCFRSLKKNTRSSTSGLRVRGTSRTIRSTTLQTALFSSRLCSTSDSPTQRSSVSAEWSTALLCESEKQ
jgi:hypothetical protein